MTVLRSDHRLRRLATLAAIVLVFGVATHGICQAIEHHDGVKDAAALCAAAVALVAAVGLLGGSRRRGRAEDIRWLPIETPIPVGVPLPASRTTPAWLQRFQN